LPVPAEQGEGREATGAAFHPDYCYFCQNQPVVKEETACLLEDPNRDRDGSYLGTLSFKKSTQKYFWVYENAKGFNSCR